MSNIEIVRLKACIRQVFLKLREVKNGKCMEKHSGKTNVYVYESYFVSKNLNFVSKVDFFEKRRNFEKVDFFRTGNF